jgi:hypothetical protein
VVVEPERQGVRLCAAILDKAGAEPALIQSTAPKWQTAPLADTLPADFWTADLSRWIPIVSASATADGWTIELEGRDRRRALVSLDQSLVVRDVAVDPVRRRRNALAPPQLITGPGSETHPFLDGAAVHVLYPRTESEHRIESFVGGTLPSWLVRQTSARALHFRVYLTNTGSRPLALTPRGDESWLEVFDLSIDRDGVEIPLDELEVELGEASVVRVRFLHQGQEVEPGGFQAVGPPGFWEPRNAYDEVLEVVEQVDGPPRFLSTYETAEVQVTVRGPGGADLAFGSYRILARWDLSGRGLALRGSPVLEHMLTVGLRSP